MTDWKKLADQEVVKETVTNLEQHGFVVEVVETGAEALQRLKDLIPAQGEVMTGSSTTLHEIGFMDLLKSNQQNWKNLQDEVHAENDDQKRADKRRQTVTAEYFLASVNAISRTGALIASDNSGSRVGALPYAAKNVLLVVSTQKIVDSIEVGMKRVRDYVFPLEDKRAQQAYGIHSSTAKWVIMERENSPQRTRVILVKENLGY